MNKDLEALLAVQQDDAGIRALEERAAGLDEREHALDLERAAQEAAVERARQALEREASKASGLQAKVTQHRELHQRNVAQLDHVRRLREATAAQAQVEMARQILSEEERELDHLNGRIRDLRAALEAHEASVAEVDERQAEQRAQLGAERAELEGLLTQAQGKRDKALEAIPRSLVSRYERIRDRRRGEAVYAVFRGACSSCDTAIPLQRRNLMADGARIEVCEGCGVLLYAAPE